MPTRFYFRLAVILAAVLSCAAAIFAWRADRRDRAQLAAELAATKQLLTAADARQRDRDAQLAKTVSALEAQKRAIMTPAQILRELPKSLPLPAPITLQGGQAPSVGATLGSPALDGYKASTGDAPAAPPNADRPAPLGAYIPRADLKPLYDFTLDCQVCQAKLSVAQNDLADEKAKTTALTKERDDALRIAKGGSAWRRVTHAAKWFLLGAAAGAIAAKAR
ncbi:MAG TPA: hypothetical protein VGR55_05560 [Candidatus Acidoferrum sp.]|nr:hypothetical protein [Candidatus Acidoferrum sp.]